MDRARVSDRRAPGASSTIGAHAVIVQAIDDRAKAFNVRFGFHPFSDREPPMTILRIAELERLLPS